MHNNSFKQQYINYNKKRMKIMKLIRQGFKKCDVFCSMEFLRYKKQPEYGTIFGGFVSIFLICTLLIVFSNKVINTLNMMSITSSVSVENDDDPTAVTISTKGQRRRSFMFGVEIWHHNLNQGIRYFDINLMNMELHYGDISNNSIEYPLEPCTLDHWKGYPLIQAKFEQIHMDYWLCPPKDIDFEIRGKYSSEISRTIQISVNKCTNNSFSQRRCADSIQLNEFFASNQQKIFFTIYFINPRINPDQAEFLTYYLADENYIIFSQTGGQEAQLMVDDFTIITDDSISPFQRLIKDEGSIVQRTAIKNRFEISQDNTNYCTFYFYKSANSIHIIRSYVKLDQILSYIGGLFGTIIMCLFLLRIYNGYSFQINMGGNLYQHDEQKEGYNKYNFWYFLQQCFYNLFKLFKSGNYMEKAKGYQLCHEELLKQLDVLYLLKRVHHLQRAIQVILDDHQLKSIHLLKKLTLSQAKRYRKNFKILEKPLQDQNGFNRKDTNSTSLPNNIILRNNQIANQHEDGNSSSYQDIQNPQSQLSIKEYPPEQTNQIQNNLSSDSQSQSRQKTVITMDQLLRLKRQKDNSLISYRIYNKLRDEVRKKIEKADVSQQNQGLYMQGGILNDASSSNYHDIRIKRGQTPRFEDGPTIKPLKSIDGIEAQNYDEFHFEEISNI